MELQKIAETAGAVITVLGLRELIPWLIKRHANKSRTDAQIEKLRAETKSTEVETLSNIIKQLSTRIDALEEDVKEIKASERKCLEEKYDLEMKIRELERNEQKRAFCSSKPSNGQGQ